ncbi:MAG: Glutamate dehydrogenase [Leptospirillum sp. Group IV 'UBA BS']|nr:MAG: Glutamate dehydrogenase [Leptospirillum sp. Group IV 'UBA BS']
MRKGFLEKVAHVVFPQTVGGVDHHIGHRSGRLFPGRDFENAIGVDLEGDLDPGRSGGKGRNAGQGEAGQAPVVLGHLPFSLEDMDIHIRLAVDIGREELLGLGRNRGVPGNQGAGDTPDGFNAQGKGGDVEKKEVFSSPRQDVGLNGGSFGNDQIGIDAVEKGFAEEGGHGLLEAQEAGRSPHENDSVHIRGGCPAVREGGPDAGQGFLHEGLDQGVHAVPGQGGPESRRRDGDLHLRPRREGNLGPFRFFPQKVPHFGAFRQSGQFGAFAEPFADDGPVEVLPTEVGIPAGGPHFEDALPDVEEGEVKGSAAQVENGEEAVFSGAQAVGQGRRSRFVDDPEDVEPCKGAGILCRLPLGVVKVGRHRDDRLCHLPGQGLFGSAPEFPENESPDLRRGQKTLPVRIGDGGGAVPVDDGIGQVRAFRFGFFKGSSHEPFGRVDDCRFGIVDPLPCLPSHTDPVL